MPANQGGESNFDLAVTRYLDAGLTGEELAQFNARLLADADARRSFVRIVRLHGMLTERTLSMEHSLQSDMESLLLADENSVISDGQDPAGESLDDASIQPAIHEEEIETPEFEGELISPAPWQPARQQLSSGGLHPYVRRGLAAILILGFSLGIWVWRRSPIQTPEIASSQQPAPRPTVVEPSPPSLSPAVQPSVVQAPVVQPPVVLGNAINAKFDPPDVSIAPGQPMPAGSLFLQSGWIRIDFPTGVTAIVEGPAHFLVQSSATIHLTSGRISAEVTPAGHGFAIDAPFCRVVDLGTEFGIAVDSQGRSRVEVFKGQVSLNRPTAAGGMAGSELLSQGSARRIDSMEKPAVSTPSQPAAFVRRAEFDRWRETLDRGDNASVTDRWRVYSEQLSRDPTLALYYTFNDRDNGNDRNGGGGVARNHAASTAGKYDLPLSSNAPTWVDGRLPGMSALNFDPTQGQRLLLGSYPLTTNGQLSATAWVFARSLATWGSIAKSWGNTRCGAFHLGLLGSSGSLDIELDGTAPGGPRVNEDKPFPTGRWVHVAFTSDGKTLRLYRDGKEVASAPSRPIAIDQPIKTISIGVKTDDDGITPSIPPQCGYWDGKIGEFALFHRALTPAEISRMSGFGPP